MGKLGRAGAALAATALLVGAGALPAAAEAAKGRLTGAKDEGVAVNMVIDGKTEDFQASLLHLKLDSGAMLKVYCVEIRVGATQQRDMIEHPWDSYPNADSPFHANRGKINWVLHNGYPFKSLDDLNKLELGFAEDGLEMHEAISATQAAIWHFSDGVTLDEADPSSRDDANQDILALYKHLVGEATDLAEQPKPVLEINPEAVDGTAGKLVGPFTVKTNGKITDITKDLPAGVELTDKDGKAITADAIADGTELFLKVPADAAAGEGSFGLSTLSKVDIGRLFVVDGYHEDGKSRGPAQSLIVAESDETKAEDTAKAKWELAPTVPPTTTTTTAPPSTTTTEPPAPTTTAPPAPAPGDDLPDTGANILVPVLVGLGLLGAGAGALIWQRRRKTA